MVIVQRSLLERLMAYRSAFTHIHGRFEARPKRGYCVFELWGRSRFLCVRRLCIHYQQGVLPGVLLTSRTRLRLQSLCWYMTLQKLAWCMRTVPVAQHAQRVALHCVCACMAAFGKLHTPSGQCSPATCTCAGWQPHHNRAAPPLALQQVLPACRHVLCEQHPTALLPAHAR